MRLRKLGWTDIEVSEISLGSWLTYSGGVEREQARRCVDAAFEVGINFIDTANVYGRGASETFLGEVARPAASAPPTCSPRRSTSRCPTPTGGSPRSRSTSRSTPRWSGCRPTTWTSTSATATTTRRPWRRRWQALTEVVREGKARHIGFSEWPAERISESLALPGVERWASSQPQYSMLWRRPEREVIPLCEREHISQIVWSPLGQGVLTGKYRPGQAPPSDSRAASESMSGFIGRLMQDDVLQAVERLRPVAEQAGLTMAQLALAWVLRLPNVASAIIGASRPEQVHENAAASGVTLSADVLEAIDAALGPVAGS